MHQFFLFSPSNNITFLSFWGFLFICLFVYLFICFLFVFGDAFLWGNYLVGEDFVVTHVHLPKVPNVIRLNHATMGTLGTFDRRIEFTTPIPTDPLWCVMFLLPSVWKSLGNVLYCLCVSVCVSACSARTFFQIFDIETSWHGSTSCPYLVSRWLVQGQDSIQENANFVFWTSAILCLSYY